jgi:hypothetical protein
MRDEAEPHMSDDLSALLAGRSRRRRARSTTLLWIVLILLIGVLIGVGLGRASAGIGQLGPPENQPAAAQSVLSHPSSSGGIPS